MEGGKRGLLPGAVQASSPAPLSVCILFYTILCTWVFSLSSIFDRHYFFSFSVVVVVIDFVNFVNFVSSSSSDEDCTKLANNILDAHPLSLC